MTSLKNYVRKVEFYVFAWGIVLKKNVFYGISTKKQKFN